MRPTFALVLLALPMLACTQVVQRDRPASVSDAAPDAVAAEQDGGQDAPEEAESAPDSSGPLEATAPDAGSVRCMVGALSYACPCFECGITYEHTDSAGHMTPWSCSTHAPGADCQPGNTCSVMVNGGTVDGTCY